MSFAPVIPQSGLAGWRFLQRTFDNQVKVFEKNPQLLRDTRHFETKINQITSAEELVSDRQLLRVALGAFGLQDDINNRFFIRKVLEGGVLKQDSLANRLGDDRYRDLSNTFGFGDLAVPSTKLSDFGEKITARFKRQQFELSVGETNESMRLALNATREIPDIAAASETDRTKWFRIMGRPPLRQVFETALGLPKSFGSLELDRQLDVFQDRAKRQLGISSFSDLSDPAVQDKLVQRYLLRANTVETSGTSSSSVALGLLMAMRR